ncbi:Uncharacterized protein FWK35_00033498 [Aphis craccivora]|uniref:MULE domain-containing protein n=1 Tax=Aphis craccivora TaxID=307492 RepID=A0A6G0VXL4_APHCR|nr:Uncharacterized protein FWK35_00033498 [Aphis craccivora]
MVHVNAFISPPKIWAKQSSDRIHRTNPCESFHSNFNSNFYHQHPHIFKIIEILKLFQYLQYSTKQINQYDYTFEKRNGSRVTEKALRSALALRI